MGIVTASLLCSIVLHLSKQNSVNGTITKTLCGIVMAISVLSPLVRFEFHDLSFDTFALTEYGEIYAQEGYDLAREELSSVIKERAESYILEKAKLYKCTISADVTLSEDSPVALTGVVIKGDVSPAVKQNLQSMIEKDLGIPRECQIWN